MFYFILSLPFTYISYFFIQVLAYVVSTVDDTTLVTKVILLMMLTMAVLGMSLYISF